MISTENFKDFKIFIDTSRFTNNTANHGSRDLGGWLRVARSHTEISLSLTELLHRGTNIAFWARIVHRPYRQKWTVHKLPWFEMSEIRLQSALWLAVHFPISKAWQAEGSQLCSFAVFVYSTAFSEAENHKGIPAWVRSGKDNLSEEGYIGKTSWISQCSLFYVTYRETTTRWR